MAKRITSIELPVHRPALARMRIREEENDPDHKYRWFRDDPDRISFMQEQFGYQFVTDPAKKSFQKSGDPGVPGDVRRAGRMVLMKCPRKLYEERAAIRNLRALQRMDAPKETFKQFAAANGFEVVDRSSLNQGDLESAFKADRIDTELRR